MSLETSLSDGMRLDGNAAAGLFSEVFAKDLTVARVTCLDCGAAGAVGALHMYAQEMGVVLRCPSCNSTVFRMVRTPTHVWIDATGSRSIAIPFL